MSVFLMGVRDPKSGKFLTVTKCGNGHDDAQLDKINKQLSGQMTKISKDADKLPSWIKCSRSLAPDFIMKDPKQAVVWEITGAEFSKSDNHTADGISIRFPRVTKIRGDKDCQTATNLDELKKLFNASKEKADFGDDSTEDITVSEPLFGAKKRKAPASESVDEEDEPQSSKSSDHTPSPSKKAKESPSKKAQDSPSKKEQESPSKKAKKECRYGASCYQKKPAHREQYSHPEEKKGAKAASDEAGEEEEFLAGQCIFLSANLPDRKTLARFVAYFGGELLELEKATDNERDDDVIFVLTGATDKVIADVPKSGRKVSVDWLTECVKQRKRLNLKKFSL